MSWLKSSARVIFFFALASGCTNKSSETTNSAVGSGIDAKSSGLAASPEQQALAQQQAALVTLVARGKSVYQQNCIACHNVDPKVAGGIGPALWQSSLELLYLKTIEGKYPEGYKPKRDGAGMPILSHLKNDIPALHAYLNN
jgi:mono/diheme cytochrome c family protein